MCKRAIARRIRYGSIDGKGRCQACMALLLAILTAIPAPVAAQMPSWMQSPTQPPVGVQGPEAAEQELPPGRRAPTPRTPQEPWAFPTITIVEPRNGTIVTRDDQQIVITFRDPRDEIDITSFRVWVNGVDRTREFQVTSNGATWVPQPRRGLEPGRESLMERQPGEFAGPGQAALGAQGPTGSESQLSAALSLSPFRLREGQNTIIANIRNLSGNLATTSGAFVLDTSLLLTTRPTPRSPVEKGFLQPPSAPPAERTLRRAPTEPTVSRDLVQFGYEAFKALLPSVTPAANLPVDPDYKLGPGDNLILYVWNIPGTALFDTATLTIDRSGSAFIPRIGAVPLQGLTLAQAQEVIRARVARNYSGFELRLALGELRAISVYVVGEVARPGTYTISPFSTVLDALFVAGGPTKMGSLRSIRVTQTAGSVREVDLYDFLLRGERPTGPMLQAGDMIFVPPIGPVAGIAGEVKRPGIYELRPGTTTGALIAMAGGPLPTAQLNRIQLERAQGPSGKIIIDLPFEGGRGPGETEMLQDGDLVTIFPSYDFLRNVVTLEGFVRTPGQYEWKPGLRLSDVLKLESLLPEAYREKIEIIRLRPDFSREVLAVNINELWAAPPLPNPSSDLELKPQDRISVHSEVIGPKTITLGGEVKRPGKYFITKGERLSDVLERAGRFLPNAFLKGGVFIRESLRRREQVELEKFVQVQTQSVLAEGSAISAGAAESGRPEFASAQTIIAQQRRELMQSLTQVVTLGRLSIHLESPEKLKGTMEDIEVEDGDFLFIPKQPVTVSVLGAVRSATAVLYKEGETVEYYVARAGGATKQADPKEIYILKADGSAQASFVKMRQLEPGDAVIVPLSVEAKIPTIMMVKDFATIIGNLAIPFGVIAGLFR